ncbi:MAG: WbqC family protein [Bacteroidales bacterium]
MRTVAIHQPNFLPWLGYFYKIKNSDVFVILNDVDFQTGNASSLTNRTRLKGPNGPFWLTIPVKTRLGSRLICDVLIDQNKPWQSKMEKTLLNFYSKTPFYNMYMERVMEVFSREKCSLSQLNTELIIFICGILEIETEIIISGSLSLSPAKKDEKILEICQKVNATHYLSGAGARKYNRPELFSKAAIDLTYTDFIHPEYPQGFKDFIPGLSILDVLFNCGRETIKFLTPQK